MYCIHLHCGEDSGTKSWLLVLEQRQPNPAEPRPWTTPPMITDGADGVGVQYNRGCGIKRRSQIFIESAVCNLPEYYSSRSLLPSVAPKLLAYSGSLRRSLRSAGVIERLLHLRNQLHFTSHHTPLPSTASSIPLKTLNPRLLYLKKPYVILRSIIETHSPNNQIHEQSPTTTIVLQRI
jgi:hypothetical protein